MSRKHSAENPKIQSNQGFTLIEVIIALGILAFGLLAIASMQITAINVNAVANDLTEGSTCAQDKLEELLALPYTDPLLTDDNATVGVVTTYTEPNPPAGFVVTWSVDNDNPVSNSKLITVTATWYGGAKTSQLVCAKPQL